MKRAFATATLLTLALWATSVHAALKYWDINGATPGSGQGTATGTWNTTGSLWSTDPTGSSAATTFNTGDTAFFSAGTDATSEWTLNLPSAITAGGVTVEEGTVDLTGAVLTLGTGNITIGSGATLSYISSGAIAASAGATMNINGGTFRTANAGVGSTFLPSTMGIILGAGGGTLSVTPSAAIAIYAGVVSGTGPLTTTGAGVFRLATAATYTGATTISGGTLQISTTANALPSGTDLTISSGAKLDIQNTLAIGSLTGAGSITMHTFTLTVGGSTSPAAFSGVISDSTYSGSITKQGSGTLTLSGVNTFHGPLTLTAGGLTVLSGGALCGSACDVTVNGGTLALNNAAQSIQGLSGASGGTISLGSGHVLTTTAIADKTFSGVITGPGALTKASTFKLTLAGGSGQTFSGGVTVSAGTLLLNNAANVMTGPVAVNGGTLEISSSSCIGGSTGDITINNNATLLADDTTAFASPILASTRNLIISSGGGILNLAGSSAILAYGGTISGSGVLTKAGPGELRVSAANSFAKLIISAGMFTAGSAGVGGSDLSFGVLPAGLTADAITLQGGAQLRANTTGITLSADRGITLGSGGGVVRSVGYVFTIPGPIAGSGLLTIGGGSDATGIIVLSGNNTYSAGTTLALGTLRINSTTALGTGALTINGGTIDNTSAGAITLANNNAQNWNANFAFIGTQDLNLGTGAVAMNTNRIVTVNGGNLTVGGPISSSAFSLTKAGVGALTLGGANTFSGGTILSAGTLNVNSTTALGTAAVTLSGGTLDNTSGGALSLANNNAQNWNGDFAFTGTQDLNLGTGAVAMNASRAVTVNGGNLTVGGAISGAGFGLTKAGPGTLILGASNAYSGGTTISGGMLDASVIGSLGAGNVTVASGAALKLDDVAAISSSARLTLNSGTLQVNLNFGSVSTVQALSFDGGVTFQDAGTWGATGSGATHIDDVHFTGAGQLNVTFGGTATVLATDGSPSTYGNTVTFTATVAGGSVTPTGSVTFKDGAATIGSAALNGAGVATLPLGSLAAGTHASITASYAGDTGHLGSTSSPVSQTVNQAVLTLTATGILVYGNDPTNAVYTAFYAGLTNSDTTNVISGSAHFSTDATSTNYIGTNYIAHVADMGTLTAANYSFIAGLDGVLTVTNRPLTVTNVLASDKVYEAGTTATPNISGAGLNGLVNGDDASVTLDSSLAAGAFANKNVGAGKTVTFSGFAAVGDLGTNYTFVQPTNATASITPLALTVSASGVDKTYDGTPAATVTLAATPLSGDSVTLTNTSAAFTDKNAAPGKTINVSGIGLAGTDAGNYAPNSTATTSGNINARPLTVTATGISKVYDGGPVATVTLADNKLAGDDVTDSYTAGVFADKNVNTGIAVAVSGISIVGVDAGNYSLANTTTTTAADITARPLTVTATGVNKPYDGGTTATVILSDNKAPGDTVTDGYSSAVFAGKNVNLGIAVAVSGISIGGANAGNYSLVNTTASTSADIMARTLTVIASGISKVYDGNLTATVTLSDNKVSGDVVTESYTAAAFASKNVNPGIAVAVSGISIGGADAGNYSLASTTATASADITARTLTVAASGVNKVYDGGTAATATLSDDKVSGDTVTNGYTLAVFADKNVNTGIAVAVSGITIGGANAGNYALANTTATASANITVRTLTVTATGVNKVYDGGTTATVTLTDDKVSGDAVTDSYISAAFADAAVGTVKPVTVSGISASGADASNYLLSSTATTTADITGAGSTALLSSSLNPSTNGGSVTFSVTVSSAAGTPTGDVVFKTNAVSFSTNSLVSGVASASSADLPVGTNTVTAEYAAQANWLGSSNSLSQVVNSAVVYSQTNAILSLVDLGGGSFELTLQGTPGAEYYVVASSDAAAAMSSWTPVVGSTNTAPSASGQWSAPVSAAAPQYYRLKAVNPAP